VFVSASPLIVIPLSFMYCKYGCHLLLFVLNWSPLIFWKYTQNIVGGRLLMLNTHASFCLFGVVSHWGIVSNLWLMFLLLGFCCLGCSTFH
jgi:hypothetical protein